MKLKIIHVPGLISLKYGGFEKYMLYMAKESAKRNYAFSVLWEKLPSDEKFIADLESVGGENIEFLSAQNRFEYVLKLTKFLKQHKYNVLHAHFNPTAILALLAARFARVPVVLSTLHSGIRPEDIPKLGFRHKLAVKARQILSHRILAVSQGVLKDFRSLGLNKHKSQVFYLGVPVKGRACSKSEMRKELGLREIDKVILCVAFHDDVKGLDILIKSLSKLTKEMPDSKLLEVGAAINPEKTRHFKDMAVEYNVSDNIIWLGHRGDVLRIMCAADVYCQPSRSEGISLAILEAMSQSLPIVASNIGGIPEVVEHDRNGLLVEPEDVDGLKNAIYEILSNPQKAETMGRLGFGKISKFNVNDKCKQQIDMYEKMFRD